MQTMSLLNFSFNFALSWKFSLPFIIRRYNNIIEKRSQIFSSLVVSYRCKINSLHLLKSEEMHLRQSDRWWWTLSHRFLINPIAGRLKATTFLLSYYSLVPFSIHIGYFQPRGREGGRVKILPYKTHGHVIDIYLEAPRKSLLHPPDILYDVHTRVSCEYPITRYWS